ncbi:MAG: TIGR03621 family F420-dependent LLM class oxidoreductase [Chloroflexi bacterium]|jgi:probable F420-dependent oxidoreductase|nr:TIGR03621 family F420-dependent LLM class oxidoreductase [Chloroflexota bacterium]
MHPFRFGVMASRAESAEDWLVMARRTEELGYSTLLVTDHLGRQLAPMVALTAAALATTRLRIGSYVLANDYRHPLMLAREAATLDLLSGGRFELGLGAGWKADDYRMLGMPYDPPALRVDRLAEALPLVGRLLAGEAVDHEGPHYRLTGATVPRSVQQPRPPILVGGGGPRMLRLAAREADIVALQPQVDPRGRPMLRQATEGATAGKVAIVREAAGGRFEHLELNVIVADAGLVGRRRPAGEALVAAGMSLATGLVGTPYVLYGTLGGLRDGLLRRRDRLGISYYALPRRAMEAMAPLVAELAGR